MIKWLPQIINQTGDDCFFCHIIGTEEKPLVNGHLNPNKGGKRPEYFARMCQSCNIKMKTNIEMMVIANDQLEKNLNSMYERGKTKTTSCVNIDELSPSAIMRINKPITRLYLFEHTVNDTTILLSDAVNAITALCNDNNGTGSQQAIRRYIDVLCCEGGEFEIFTEVDGRLRIRRRN